MIENEYKSTPKDLNFDEIFRELSEIKKAIKEILLEARNRRKENNGSTQLSKNINYTTQAEEALQKTKKARVSLS